MNKVEFLKNLQTSRAEWDALIAQAQSLGDDAMVARPEDGGWSLKDFVAHNIWYESEILRLLKTRNLSYGPADELWATRDDERNAVLYDMFRDMPLADVMAEEQQVYKDLLGEIRKLTDADLNDPRRFKDIPMDWVPGQLLAENSYDHYRSHYEDVKKLIEILEESKKASQDNSGGSAPVEM